MQIVGGFWIILLSVVNRHLDMKQVEKKRCKEKRGGKKKRVYFMMLVIIHYNQGKGNEKGTKEEERKYVHTPEQPISPSPVNEIDFLGVEVFREGKT